MLLLILAANCFSVTSEEVSYCFPPRLTPLLFSLKKKGWHRRAKQRATRELSSQDEVNNENRRNTRTRMHSKLAVHQEETSPARGSKDPDSIKPQDSQSSLRSRKEGTMQKIGDFLQRSPTFFGSKAKKIMGLVSGKSPETEEGGSSMNFRPKKSKRKLYRPEISSPMDFPSHRPEISSPMDFPSHPVRTHRQLPIRMIRLGRHGHNIIAQCLSF
ncbi:unnamed protein product [Oncorhynchus mykiss]|uniref:Uncharacterized protein n=1 Tax=Oncorhynchus mykiss TaxID=8022 RepID=A0A060Y7F1_ONCMY|nr:unnamed protein product [Oncorhynchus mykiss]